MFLNKLSSRKRIILLTIILAELILYFCCKFVFVDSINSKKVQQRKLYAEVQADITESFFNVFTESMLSFSRLTTVCGDSVETVFDMDEFVDWWRKSGLLGGLLITDKNGKVILNSNNLDTRDLGGDLSDRDYFYWARSQYGQKDELFVGRPVISRLGGSKGQPIIPVASAIVVDGEFRGVLAASVLLEPLMMQYVSLLDSSDSVDLFLIDRQGEVVYANSKLELSELWSDRLGYLFDAANGGSFVYKNYSASYSKLNLGNQEWLLVSLVPVCCDPRVGYISFSLILGLTILLYYHISKFI